MYKILNLATGEYVPHYISDYYDQGFNYDFDSEEEAETFLDYIIKSSVISYKIPRRVRGQYDIIKIGPSISERMRERHKDLMFVLR